MACVRVRDTASGSGSGYGYGYGYGGVGHEAECGARYLFFRLLPPPSPVRRALVLYSYHLTRREPRTAERKGWRGSEVASVCDAVYVGITSGSG